MKRYPALIGPTVWEDDGPTPIVKSARRQRAIARRLPFPDPASGAQARANIDRIRTALRPPASITGGPAIDSAALRGHHRRARMLKDFSISALVAGFVS